MTRAHKTQSQTQLLLPIRPLLLILPNQFHQLGTKYASTQPTEAIHIQSTTNSKWLSKGVFQKHIGCDTITYQSSPTFAAHYSKSHQRLSVNGRFYYQVAQLSTVTKMN